MLGESLQALGRLVVSKQAPNNLLQWSGLVSGAILRLTTGNVFELHVETSFSARWAVEWFGPFVVAKMKLERLLTSFAQQAALQFLA